MSKRFQTTVVGMQYRVSMSARRMIRSWVTEHGTMDVYLAREPDNPKDENAIKVVAREKPYRGIHLGYVPRAVSEIYATALDNLKVRIIDSYITAVQPEEGTATLHLEVKRVRGVKTSATKPKKKKSAKRA